MTTVDADWSCRLFCWLLHLTDYRYELMHKKKIKGQSWDRVVIKIDRGFCHLEKKNVSESTSKLLLLARNPIFTEWFGKSLQATALICLPCCAILACS